MKTYATLGPACCRADLLTELLDMGLTGFRLNLSHTTLAACRPWTEAVQQAREASGRPAELIVDMRGPELRMGPLSRPVTLTAGETVTLTAGETVTLGPGGLPVEPDILAAVAPGQEILLDDGLMALRAESCGRAVTCTVTRGGVLESRKSITLPGVELLRPALTEQDLLDLDAAAGQGVTAVMQPFVRSRHELEQVRAALARRGLEHLTIFAKIEDRRGWQSLPQWMDACDVVTVARGDLGSNLGLLHLPAAQKDIAARCRRAGKPFLVVTQLLHTMTEHPTPTRAEVLDVYNAVLDGASALMLTGETARGRYPVQAVRWLLDIARQAE
mgnify:CR=1 FL=1